MVHRSIFRHKTALKRYNFSRPINTAIANGLINPSKTFFDYGCGLGDDIKRLERSGIQCSGWDTEYRPTAPRHPADIVNLGYVINVVEDQHEREAVLKSAWDLSRDVLIVSAQLYIDAKTARYTRYKDCYLTKRGTFQKFFDQKELHNWISGTLGEGPVPAAPASFMCSVILRQRKSLSVRNSGAPRPRRGSGSLMSFLRATGTSCSP